MTMIRFPRGVRAPASSLFAAVAACLLSFQAAHAAPTTPASISLGSGSGVVEFSGGPIAGANVTPTLGAQSTPAGDHVCTGAGVECDALELSVDTAGFEAGTTVELRVTVAWDDPDTDLDIYLVDSESSETLESAATAGNPEAFIFEVPAGVSSYIVDIVPFLATFTAYSGTVELRAHDDTGGGGDDGEDLDAADSIDMACEAAFEGLDTGASVAAVDPNLELGVSTRLVLTFANRASSKVALQRLQAASWMNAASAYELANLYFVVLPEVRVTQALIDSLRLELAGTDMISIWGSHPQAFQIDTSGPFIGVTRAREAFATPELPLTGKGIGVGVIDTGWDRTQGDFESLAQASGVRMIGASAVETDNTETNQGHGTHIIGTIAGDGAQSGGQFVGLAPEVNMLSIAVDGAFPYLFIEEGVDYMIENMEEFGIRVSNHSYGPQGSGFRFNPASPNALAAKRAYDAGIIQVYAAGNNGPNDDTIGPDAQNPCVIAVANGDRASQLAGSSSRGTADGSVPGPDITAPGTAITASRAVNGATSTTTPRVGNTAYATISGTSMAAPHIVATIAIMLEANPDLGFGDVLSILQDTARPMFRPDGTEYAVHEVGAGYVDVAAAVASVLGEEAPVEPTVILPGAGTTRTFEQTGVAGQTTIVGCFGCPNGDAGFGTHRYVYELPPAADYASVTFGAEYANPERAYSLEVFDPDGNSVGVVGNDVNGGVIQPGEFGNTNPQITVDTPTPGVYLIDFTESLSFNDTFTITADVTCPAEGCNHDFDRDGVLADADNCPTLENADQADADGDGEGDVCDATPNGNGNGNGNGGGTSDDPAPGFVFAQLEHVVAADGLTVAFNASGSYKCISDCADAANHIALEDPSYTFYFRDNTGDVDAAVVDMDQDGKIEYTYGAAGEFKPYVLVRDGNGNSDAVADTVITTLVIGADDQSTVNAARLTASYDRSNPVVPLEVIFDASQTTVADGFEISSYAFDFDDGSQVTTTSPVVQHTYVTAGTYAPSVTVTFTDDSGGTDFSSAKSQAVRAVTGGPTTPSTPSSPTTSAGGGSGGLGSVLLPLALAGLRRRISRNHSVRDATSRLAK